MPAWDRCAMRIRRDLKNRLGYADNGAMSLETLELARRSFELWSRGDLDAWIETIDPAIGWDISTYPLPMFRTTVEGARRL
jgi:hypothetical protein